MPPKEAPSPSGDSSSGLGDLRSALPDTAGMHGRSQSSAPLTAAAKFAAMRAQKAEKAQTTNAAANTTPASTVNIAGKRPMVPAPGGPTQNWVAEKKVKPPSWSDLDLSTFSTASVTRNCRLQVEDGVAIGALRARQGYGVKLQIDAGRHGNPRLVLHFRSNPIAKIDKPLSADQNEHEYFTLEFYPGVKAAIQPDGMDIDSIAANYMIELFQHVHVTKASAHEMSEEDEKAIEKLKHQWEKDNVMLIEFTLYDCSIVGSINENVWGAHGKDMQDVIRGLTSPDSTDISIWCELPKGPDGGEWLDKSLIPFTNAVKEHIQPMFPYYSEGAPLIDLRNAPTIDTVGGGMYRMPPKKNRHGQVIRNARQQYSEQPVRKQWTTHDELRIFAGMHVVREHQYQVGQVIHTQFINFGIFLQKLSPRYEINGQGVEAKGITYDLQHKPIEAAYLAWVRAPVKNGIKEATLTDDTPVLVQFGPPNDLTNTWEGTVVRRDGRQYAATGTDFAILIHRPVKAREPLHHTELKFVPTRELLQVRIRVKTSEVAAHRELKATEDFVRSKHPVCQTLVGAMLNRKAIEETVDVTGGPEKDEALAAALEEELKTTANTKKYNKVQLQAFRAQTKVRGGLGLIVGPPGTGKTYHARDSGYRFVGVGHKVVYTATTNAALDNMTESLHFGRPADFPKDKGKLVRIEIGSVESMAMRRGKTMDVKDRTEISKDDLNKAPGMGEEEDLAVTDPVFVLAFDRFQAELDENDDLFNDFAAQTENNRDSFNLVRDKANQARPQNVPLATTLQYQIWELTMEDKLEAEASYNAEYEGLQAKYKNPAQLADHANMMISAADRSKSKRFLEYRELFKRRGGRIGRKDRDMWEVELMEMTRRALKKVDILLISANNAGSAFNELGFDPTIIFSEESSQSTLAQLAVPLTAFPNWQACFMYGDPKQLEPTVLSARYNEFYLNAKMSPMRLFIEIGHPHLQFKEQYRMAPEISQFPSKRYYAGDLIDSDFVKQNDTTKDAIRNMTLTKYGLKGSNGKGVLYWVNNVTRSVARHESEGSSLENYANANAVVRRIADAIEAGLRPDQITVLTHYRAEVRLVINNLRASDPSDTLEKVSEGVTIDSYQGKEADFVILDTVAADSGVRDETSDQKGLEEDESAELLATFIRGSRLYNNIPPFVKNSHRLCVALTRARKGLVIITHAASAIATSNGPPALAEKSDLCALIDDARSRHIVYEDTTSLDDHPEALAARANKTEQEQEREMNVRRADETEFMREHDRQLRYGAARQPSRNQQRHQNQHQAPRQPDSSSQASYPVTTKPTTQRGAKNAKKNKGGGNGGGKPSAGRPEVHPESGERKDGGVAAEAETGTGGNGMDVDPKIKDGGDEAAVDVDMEEGEQPAPTAESAA